MEEVFRNWICCALASMCAGVATTCLVYGLLAWARRLRLLSAVDAQRVGVCGQLARKGIPSLLGVSHVLCRVKPVQRFCDNVADWLVQKGCNTTGQAVCSLAVAVCAVTIVGSFCVTQSLFGAIAIPLCGIVLVSFFMTSKKEKHQELICDSVPDALQSMSSCFQSGLSLLQTFHQVASEINGPLQAQFKRAANSLETGGTVRQALTVFEKGESSELAFVAVALDVQHETGGSMRHVLDAARETVEGQIELKRSLRVQTAQAKLSARVVSLMPFLLVALFTLMSPDFLEPFFSSTTGFVLLLVALLMQVAGVLLVRRMLAVEVC